MAEFGIASKIIPPTAQDPLALANEATGLQGAMLKTKLLGANVAQTLAQRQAAQAAVGPDGQFDIDKYEAALGSGGASPEALLQAQQGRQQKLQAQISQLGLTSAQLDLSEKELGHGAMVGQGILANGTKNPALLTKQAISDAIDNNLIQPGLVRSPEGIAHAKQFVAALTDDPQKNAEIVQQFVNQSTDITKAMGAIRDVNVGGSTIQMRTNPANGENTVSGAVAMGRSPSEKANLVQVYDPVTKTTKMVPSGEIIGDSAPAAQHPQVAPALGEAQQAQTNVQMASDLQQRAGIVGDRRAALKEMVGALDKFATGPKAQTIGALKGFATQFGLSTKGIDESKAAQDEFNKLASQVALQQWGALGGTGSNHQLDTAAHTNPNELMSNMGAKNVIALLIGNEDAIDAKYQAWQKYKGVHGASSFDTFQEGWNRYYDPRVFQAQHMTPVARTDMLSRMTADERKTFKRDEAIAKQAGWLNGG